MLRNAILMISVLGALGAIFFLLVVRAQPAGPVGTTQSVPVTPTDLSGQQHKGGIGPGRRPWIVTYKDGQVSSQFNASEFTPQKDGSFFVKDPISIFYMSDGQYMLVTGDDGTVYCDSSPSAAGKLLSAPTTTPKNGWLNHVRIELYPKKNATRPTLWMETDNIHFDNDYVRMYTGSTKDKTTGQVITADQVPVTMRGDDYEFDGKGLNLWWNSSSRRLQKLQVSHGRRLEIKNPAKLSLPGMAPAEPIKHAMGNDVDNETSVSEVQADENPRAKWDWIGSDSPNLLSNLSWLKIPHGLESAGLPDDPAGFRSRLRKSVPQPVLLKKPVTVSNAELPPTPYRATFNDDVEIKQGDRTMAVARIMMVDFLQGKEKPEATVTSITAQPNLPAQTASAAPSIPATAAAAVDDSVPVAVDHPGAGPGGDAPITTPASKPGSGPVTITWTGMLLVTPLETEPLLPLSPGQSVVRLVGDPVKLTPEGSTVHCLAVTYRSPDGAARLEGTSTDPVEMARDSGMKFTTESIDYNPATSIATLLGQSQMSVPVGKEKMTVNWNKPAQLHMTRGVNQSQPSGVDRINLAGDVAVAHPQFTLNSQRLQLDLEPAPKTDDRPSEKPVGKTEAQAEAKPDANSSGPEEQLKLLTASEDVKCRLIHPGEVAAQGIDSNLLVIRTERGMNKQTVAREVIADGAVHAFDPDQSLNAGHLDALLLPRVSAPLSAPPAHSTGDVTDAAGAVDLESLHATGNVHAKLKSGAIADTDDLQVAGTGNLQTVDMAGTSTKLSDGKGSYLKSPLVHIIPVGSVVNVPGAGLMQMVRSEATTKPSEQKPPKIVVVTWKDSMALNGSANSVDVLGTVTVHNADADGTLSTITGDKAHLDLMDDPKALIKDVKKAPTTKPSDTMASAMGGKTLKRLTMDGHVVGSSDLNAPDGSVVRQGRLFCDLFFYTTADGIAEVPGPGKMFVENHGSTNDKPAAEKTPDDRTAGAKASTDTAGTRGAMAISWQQKLIYDQTGQTITFTGNTIVGFEQENNDDKTRPASAKPKSKSADVGKGPMQIKSDKVVVKLQAPKVAAPAKTNEKMQLADLKASGHVNFLAKGVEMTCDSADYNPETSIMTAKGTPQEPVQVMDDTGNLTGTFDEVDYDSIKQEVVRTKGAHIKARK